MDIAASLKAHPEKIRRSILFLLVTAEEKGLLGSKYFAAHPTVAAKSIIADVNVDMFLPIVPLKILKVGGLEESDLGSRAAAIAQAMASNQSPIPSHFATRSFAAISTTSSGTAFRRSSATSASSLAHRAKSLQGLAHQSLPRAERRREPAR